MMTRVNALLAPLVFVAMAANTTLGACPFCDPVTQTLSEEILSMDAVILVELLEMPKFKEDDEELAKAKFKITKVVKGQKLVGKTKVIETIYFGEPKPKQQFLVMGVDPPKLMWSTPLAVSKRAITYMTSLPSLPETGPKRLEFFQDFLEDKDELLARDAYDEFAKSPYKTILQLKSKLKHAKLISWIQSPDVPASRRRLYLTLLGVCGSNKDLPLLEKMLRSDDRRFKSGLDALVGCYLTLKGPAGLALIEELFLKNHDSEYADTYATIMALRFHGNETTIIPKKRILQSLHHMLDRPQLADLVIPDLARWKDWSQVDRLVKLFKSADDKSSWVRVPVINYLRRCPLPKAKEQIAALEKIDPAAVRRANTFFPFRSNESDAVAEDKSEKKKSAGGNADSGSQKQGKTSGEKTENGQGQSDKAPDDNLSAMVPPPAKVIAEATQRASAGKSEAVAVAASPKAAGSSRPKTNTLKILGVPLLVGLGLLALQWGILRGAGSQQHR